MPAYDSEIMHPDAGRLVAFLMLIGKIKPVLTAIQQIAGSLLVVFNSADLLSKGEELDTFRPAGEPAAQSASHFSSHQPSTKPTANPLP